MKITKEMQEWRAAGMSLQKIADRLGCGKTSVQRAFARSGRVSAPKPPAAPSSVKVRNLTDFRREHDQAWKIRDGLKRLFAGGVYMTDAEFRDAVSANPSRWRHAADSSEFSEYRYRVHGEVLWASKETIREMRKIRGEAI